MKRRSASYVSARPDSSFTAISAILWRIAWCFPIGRPKASRSSANSRVRSRIACIEPTEPSAIASLPLEVRHDQVEAAVLLAEQVLLRHEDVGERQLGRVRRV